MTTRSTLYEYRKEEASGTYMLRGERGDVIPGLSPIDLIEFSLQVQIQYLLSQGPRITNVSLETRVHSIAKCLLEGRDACWLSRPEDERRVQAWVALQAAAQEILTELDSSSLIELVQKKIDQSILRCANSSVMLVNDLGILVQREIGEPLHLGVIAKTAVAAYQSAPQEEGFSEEVRQAVRSLKRGGIIRGNHSPDVGIYMDLRGSSRGGSSRAVPHVNIDIPEFMMEYPKNHWLWWEESHASVVFDHYKGERERYISDHTRCHPFIYRDGIVCIGDTHAPQLIEGGRVPSSGMVAIEQVHLLREVIMYGAHAGNNTAPVNNKDTMRASSRFLSVEEREALERRGVRSIPYNRNM
jgi:hypothetical protein